MTFESVMYEQVNLDTVKFSRKKLAGTLDNDKIILHIHVFLKLLSAQAMLRPGGVFINLKFAVQKLMKCDQSSNYCIF